MAKKQNEVVVKRNDIALAGLICSIMLGGIIGLVLSIIGYKRADEYHDGKGVALAGIIVGLIKIPIMIIASIGIMFSGILWPNIRSNIIKSTYCSQAYNCKCGKDSCDCKYMDDYGKEMNIKCDIK